MANRIAVAQTVDPAACCVEYLDDTGQPWCFQQNPDGSWQPRVKIGLPGGAESLVGLQAAGSYFLAVNSNATLCFGQPGAQLYFLELGGNYTVSDFAFDYVPNLGGGDGGYLTAFIDQHGFLSAFLWSEESVGSPTRLSPTTNFGGQYLGNPGTNYVAVGHVIGASNQGAIGVIIAVYDGSGSEPPTVQGWTTSDGTKFVPVKGPNALAPSNLVPPNVNETPQYFCSVRLVNGNRDGTLQAILLAGAKGTYPQQPYTPLLMWDSSGTASAWTVDYEALQGTPALSMTAAATDSLGNLQVIGLGLSGVPIPNGLGYPYWVTIAPWQDGMPYLVWQDTFGGWHSYGGNVSDPWASRLPIPPPLQFQACDLAVSMGAQNTLQVAYIGFDGNVYINWQNTSYGWGWYGGQNGKGLP